MYATNKHGQAIGRKGAESRRRLLDATRDLIAIEPAHRLTASAIARTAGLASQTFYLYFKDIDEVLLSLSREASDDMQGVLDTLGNAWHDAAPAEQSKRFIEAFTSFWDRNRPILTVRNYFSDSGHAAFLTVRQESAMPVIQAIARRMLAAHPDHDLDDKAAFARSVIIYSAIERMAARPATLSHQPVLVDATDLQQAEADILTLLFTPAAASVGRHSLLAPLRNA